MSQSLLAGFGARERTVGPGKERILNQRWAIAWAIDGDLKFFSHHDLLRAIERLVARAKLPLRFSQGFNPRPAVSLPCPHPVGVASDDERLIISLEAAIEPEDLCQKLNAQALEGMTFLKAKPIDDGVSTLPQKVIYTLLLPPEDVPTVTERLQWLASQPEWPLQRKVKTRRTRRGRSQGDKFRTVDIKPMVADMTLNDNELRIELVVHENRWARPLELMELLGLQGPEYIARLVRRHIVDAARLSA